MSKKITLSADGATATVAEAKISDIVGTLFSPDEAVTGTYKYLQLGAAALAGNMYSNRRHSGSFTNFG